MTYILKYKRYYTKEKKLTKVNLFDDNITYKRDVKLTD